MRLYLLPLCLSVIIPFPVHAQDQAADKVLYDFEDPAMLKSWSNLDLKPLLKPEPPVTFALSTDHATSGKHSLKLTFAGGEWPTIATTEVTQDWFTYLTFKADVTVPRTCVVGFTLFQEKSTRGGGWDNVISHWTTTAFMKPGKNTVVATLPASNDYAVHPKWGKAIRFEIFMYSPRPGESIYVDNVRLSKEKLLPREKRKFTIQGTDWTVSGESSAQAVQQFGRTLAPIWNPPVAKSLDEVEQEFQAKHDLMKKRFSKAVLAVFRDGDKDPADPEKVYAGWKDAYWNSHGPDANFVDRGHNQGKRESHEIFMRHRSPLMRVDLSSIPNGSNILAAQLVIVRVSDKIAPEHDPAKRPTMWVVEPCNRPWEEYEVNAFQYAKDKFWTGIGGGFSEDDPDYLATFLAFGPGRPGRLHTLDFANAVRFWTDGKHVNHGFMLHGDGVGYMVAFSREAADVRNRPMVLVSYVPKG